MKTIAAVFSSRTEAERALDRLRGFGLREDQISILTPEASDKEINAVPTIEAEQPGMGKAIGAVVGGAVGLSGGLQISAFVGSLLLPGVGPIIGIGFAGAALAGLAGAVGGAAAGNALEDAFSQGLPRDELYFYEDALRKGRTVVIFRADEEEQAQAGREALLAAGAESLDAAREQWWIGLRDAEEAEYNRRGTDFGAIEPMYRRGFEAALHLPIRGKQYEEAIDYLRKNYPEAYRTEDFRRGFERGLAYWSKVGSRRPH